MAEILKDWAQGFCITLFVSGAVLSLSPGGKLKSALKVVCVSAVILSLAVPFINKKFDSKTFEEFDTQLYLDKAEQENEYLLTMKLSQIISGKIDKILSQGGFPDCEINVLLSINSQNEAEVQRVDICTHQNKEIDSKTQGEIRALLGGNAVIVYS